MKPLQTKHIANASLKNLDAPDMTWIHRRPSAAGLMPTPSCLLWMIMLNEWLGSPSEHNIITILSNTKVLEHTILLFDIYEISKYDKTVFFFDLFF